MGERTLMTGKILRLLLGDFFAVLLVTQASAIALYVVVDFFERLDVILRNTVEPVAVARYFVFKLPLIVSQTLAVSTAIAIVAAIAVRHRHNEILALEAAGVGPRRIALAFSGATILICLFGGAWAEWVVPPATRAAQEISLREIKKRDRRNVLADREIWLRRPHAIYHVTYVDQTQKALLGVTAYVITEDFSLQEIRYFPEIRWTSTGWSIIGHPRQLPVPGTMANPPNTSVPSDYLLQLPESFEEFAEVQREPEEQSTLELWNKRAFLRTLGLPTTRVSVDLYLKTALPFAPLAIAAILLPVALRLDHAKRIAKVVAFSAALGFGYWVLLGVATSLGYAGTLPALLAAWLANLTYGTIGAGLLATPAPHRKHELTF